LRWVVGGYLILIASILVYNAKVTNDERASALVVNIAGRQHALAERYIKDVLLTSAGFQADSKEDAVTLQQTADALLAGGNVLAVQGADGTVWIPPASKNWKVVAKLQWEQTLISRLVARGRDVLRTDPADPSFPERVMQLRIIGAQVSNITHDAVGQMTLDLDASLSRFVGVGLALGLVGAGAAIAMAVLLRRVARSQARQFGALVHRASDLVTVINADGTVRYQSASVEQVLGLSSSEIVGANLAALIHPDDVPVALAAWADLATRPSATGRFEYRIRDGNGSWRHVESAATNLLTDPTVGGLVLNTRDVTERHEVEATLRKLQIERGMLLERTVQATEQERKRIAAELHDGAVQQLTTLAFRVATITERVGEGQTEGSLELLERVETDLLGQIQGLRKMMTHLRPPILDERGLEAALRDHVVEMEPGVELQFSVEADLAARLSPAQEILLYRVAQEAVSNVVKHAQAEHAWVKLQERSGRILLEIRDDGVGFDPGLAAESGRNGHFGILGMRERVELAGGLWELESVAGAGTLVRAHLPRER
jgi:PAS domain S-box-containing protein